MAGRQNASLEMYLLGFNVFKQQKLRSMLHYFGLSIPLLADEWDRH